MPTSARCQAAVPKIVSIPAGAFGPEGSPSGEANGRYSTQGAVPARGPREVGRWPPEEWRGLAVALKGHGRQLPAQQSGPLHTLPMMRVVSGTTSRAR